MLARAKVNLALHVTGHRPDGYHLLDTMVAFPDIGDRIRIEPADDLRLTVDGPSAADLSAENGENLVLKAAGLLARERSEALPGVLIRLTKNLPIASGIGGGSADAAAILRMLNRYWHLNLSDMALTDYAAQLGADVPMCLHSTPLRAQGIGAVISKQPPLPACGILLINPGTPLSTPDVFKTLTEKTHSPISDIPEQWASFNQLIGWLEQTRNDLEASARRIVPGISDVLEALDAEKNCRFARMSGSGATCFGLFANRDDAEKAARTVSAEQPGWWVQAGSI